MEHNMNGEFNQLYNELKKDLEVFDARQQERWKAHDERATRLHNKIESMEENFGHIKTLILDKFANLQCKTHIERFGNYSIALKVLYGLIVLILGVIFKLHLYK